MIKQQNDVREFHEAVGALAPTAPLLPSKETAILRFNLIMEELLELAEAMGLTIDGHKAIDFDESKIDMIEIVDAVADILYVTFGSAVAVGVDIEPFWNEVQRSNMSKVKDGYKRESDSKWMKGPSYSPADIKGLYDQIYGAGAAI